LGATIWVHPFRRRHFGAGHSGTYRSQHFWFEGLKPRTGPKHISFPFFFPFSLSYCFPRYRSPSLSVFFPFRLASFSLGFPVPTLNLAMSGDRCGITSSEPCVSKSRHCTAPQCSRGRGIFGNVAVYLKLELVRLGPDSYRPAGDYNSTLKPRQAARMPCNGFLLGIRARKGAMRKLVDLM